MNACPSGWRLPSYIEWKKIINKYGGHSDQLSQKYFAMDYWRVKAMDELRQSGVLTDEQESELNEVLKEKCRILKLGYTKHNNLEHLPYVEILLDG